ncbi:MAG: 6-bladed beta-propeller [Acidobacteriota bacterium]|nr:6-bladed beta-propeller [Acidobacteriota bacterium]
MISLLLFGIFSFETEWERFLPVYTPLPPGCIAYTESKIYLVSYMDRKILVFDYLGRQDGAFGGIGQGPGELNQSGPMTLQIYDNQLYVHMSRKTVVFDLKGKYLASYSVPHLQGAPFGLEMRRVPQGWLVFDFEPALGRPDAGIMFFDPELKQGDSLCSWEREKPGMSGFFDDKGQACLDREARTLFVRRRGETTISVWNMITMQQTGTLDLGLEMQLVPPSMRESYERISPNRTIPERIPAAFHLLWRLDRLVVGYLKPEGYVSHRFFTRNGKEDTIIPSTCALMVFVIRDQWAYLVNFSLKEDQLMMARWPLNRLEQKIKDWKIRHND